MKTTIQRNSMPSGDNVVALRMFKRNGLSYSPITIMPLSNGVCHRTQSVAAIH